MMGLLGSFVLMLLLPLFVRECEGIGGGEGAVLKSAKIAIAWLIYVWKTLASSFQFHFESQLACFQYSLSRWCIS